MSPSLFIWSWLVTEMVVFAIFSSVFSLFFSIILIIAGSFYGRWLLANHLRKMAYERRPLEVSPSEEGYRLVGAVLFLIPGIFSSILGACFVFNGLRLAVGRKLWDFLHPEEIYDRYENSIKGVMVDVRRPDGSKVDAEIINRKDRRD